MKANHARANVAQTVSDRSSRLTVEQIKTEYSKVLLFEATATARVRYRTHTPRNAPYGAWGREAPGVGARARRAQSRAH